MRWMHCRHPDSFEEYQHSLSVLAVNIERTLAFKRDPVTSRPITHARHMFLFLYSPTKVADKCSVCSNYERLNSVFSGPGKTIDPMCASVCVFVCPNYYSWIELPVHLQS